jgi:hypothetical protein
MVSAVTKTFAISLGKISNGVATKGGLTETAPSVPPTILSGSMWLQDPAAFLQSKIAGPYAFVFNGWNASQSYGSREAMGGTVTADGAGNLTTGLLDDKVYGAALPVTAAWTGTYGVPSSNGRTALTASALTGANGSAVLYMVNADQLIAMISDTTSAGHVFSGSMLAQQAGAFSQASLNGNIVTYQTANYSQPGYGILTTSTLTLFAQDGTGNLPITSYDQNNGGNIYHASGIVYTYTVAANGHAIIYTAPSTTGGRWYLTGQNTGLILGFDYGVSVGTIVPQSAGTLSAASISGEYFACQAPGGSIQSPYSSGPATSNGNGMLFTTIDVNYYGFISGLHGSSTLIADPLVNGRITDTSNKVIYAVSPSNFLMLNIELRYDSANATSAIQIFEQ